MEDTSTRVGPSLDAERMHAFYRAGGKERFSAPHVVYSEPTCPHRGCDCRMQAVDFRLGDHGRDVHDRLVAAWWDDRGFAGRCPQCGGWVHFTIRQKRAVSQEEAAGLPQLPEGWYAKATVL